MREVRSDLVLNSMTTKWGYRCLVRSKRVEEGVDDFTECYAGVSDVDQMVMEFSVIESLKIQQQSSQQFEEDALRAIYIPS